MTDDAASPNGAARVWLVRIGIGVALAAFAIALCRRSIVLADEGYLLMQSWDLLQGRVPYRDMDAFVTPGIWLVLAGTFALLGPSVIASRLPALLALLALYGVGHRIASRLAAPAWGGLAVAGLAVCTVWAFPAWTFAFYSPFSVLFALLALERLLAWRDGDRMGDLLACGVLAGLSVVFKQNYGVFALGGLAASVLAVRAEQGLVGAAWLRRSLRDGAWMALGTAAAGLPFLVWLALSGALPDAWQSLVVHPFEFSGRHDIPYLSPAALFRDDFLKDAQEMLTYGAQPVYRVPPAAPWLYHAGIVERMHVPFYWLPPVLLALGLWLSLRRRGDRRIDAGLFAAVAVAAAIFLGVFPRADFNHLANVYQPVVIAGAVVAHRLFGGSGRPRGPWMRAAAAAVAATALLYAAVAAYWAVALLEHLDRPLAADRAGVLARPEQAARIDYQVETILAETRPGEALLTIPDLAMLNFLTDRPMPSRYYNLYEHHIAHDGGEAVARGAERGGARLAITRYDDFFSDRVGLRRYAPRLVDYLRTHFETRYTVGREDFIHLLRRESPVPLPTETPLLPSCDTTRGYQRVREHLLFPALHHDPGTGAERQLATVETPCTVAVPRDGATLTTRIDYRAPLTVAPGTTLTAEILVIERDRKRLMARKQYAVEPRLVGAQRRPLAPELRVDLSEWAGESVHLLLRTTRRGRVHIRPREVQGFGTVWEDPKLVRTPE